MGMEKIGTLISYLRPSLEISEGRNESVRFRP